ncbi:hypothetical protein AtEden1_Chr5g0106811 [Arabidopsis thaliana]
MIEKEGAGGDRKEKHMGVVGSFAHSSPSLVFFLFFFFCFFERTLVLSRRGGAHARYYSGEEEGRVGTKLRQENLTLGRWVTPPVAAAATCI